MIFRGVSLRSRRVRTAVALGAAAAVALTAAILAMPEVLRRIAVTRLGAATGRPVTIENVDFNLFTRRLVVESLAIGEPGGAPPLARFRRLDVRSRLLPLLAGRLEVASIVLERPVLHIVRSGPSEVNFADVMGRLLAGESKPVRIVLDRLVVAEGSVVFEDRAVEPPQRWEARTLRVELRDVTTIADAASGTAAVAFVLAGAPVSVAADQIRLRPLHARATVSLERLDLAPAALYIPSQAALRFHRGHLTTRFTLVYDARTGLRADGEAAIAHLGLLRRGQDEPFVVAPALRLTFRDMVYRDGMARAGRFELTGDPSVLDASLSPRQEIAVRPLHVVAEDLSYPVQRPGRLTVTANLLGGARLAAEGAVEVFPVAADLAGSLTGVDLALLRPYLPHGAPVTLEGGRLGARLALRVTASGPEVGGDFEVTDLALQRPGQAEAFVTEPRLAGKVEALTVRDGALAIRRLVLSGAPTILDASVMPPQRYDLAALSLTIEDAVWPRGGPARVRASAALADGSAATLDGTVDPATLSAEVRGTLHDLDLARLVPYVPAGVPVQVTKGRLRATLALRHDRAAGVRAEGEGAVESLEVLRRGDPRPFVSVPRLSVAVSGFGFKDGAVGAERVAVSGGLTIVDGGVAPPQRYEVKAMEVGLRDAAWPRGGPARVDLAAELTDGGRLTARGSVGLAPLTLALRVGLQQVDLTRIRPYLPAALPVRVERGRLQGTLAVRYGPGAGAYAAGDLAVEGLALLRAGQAEPFLAAPRVTLALHDLRLRDGVLRAEKVAAAGEPTLRLEGTSGPAPPLDLGALRLAAEGIVWPGTTPAHVTLALDLPRGGSLSADGTVGLAARAAELTVAASQVPLEPYRPYLPVDARVDGALDAAVTLAGTFQGEPRISVRGTAGLTGFELGPPERPLVAVEGAAATGLRVEWPGRLAAQHLHLRHPRILIERDAQGFPLRRILARRPGPAPGGGSGPVGPHAGGAPPTPGGRPGTIVEIGRLTVQDGEARFIDRTTSPFYSEEVTQLALTVEGLSNASRERARVSAQGIVGASAAVDLRGEVDAFGPNLFLEVSGEMHDFDVPRVNPYARRLLDWIAESGRLTTRVHYRITGDRLEATNDFVVERLDVARVGSGGTVEKRIGLPLGLVVALLKGARGEIHLSVPVSGKIDSPEFSLGEAVLTAVRNVIVKLITAPFRLIGRVFTQDDKIEELKIDPLRFDPGSSVVSPALERQLQRVADFLRASPFIWLSLKSLVSSSDLVSLRTHAVTARIEEVQRAQRLPDFPSAAVRAFQDRYPDRPVPKTVDGILADLREDEQTPEEAARRLAARRVAAARSALITAAGIEPARLLEDRIPPALGAEGDGRIEFGIRPAG